MFLVTFPEFFFDTDSVRVAGTGDMHWYYAPMQFYLDTHVGNGDFPLWNSGTYSGMPLAAHPLAMAFYPPNLLRSILIDAQTPVETFMSLHALTLFHVILLSLGMYGLARQESLRRSTSLVISFSSAFSSIVVESMSSNPSFLYTTAWAPAILCCLAKATNSIDRRRQGWLLVAGLLYGHQILAGLPQIILYSTLMYILYVLLSVRRTPDDVQTVRFYGSWVTRIALFGIVGALLGSALMLPASEYLGLSARAPGNFQKFEEFDKLTNIQYSGYVSHFVKLFFKTPGLDSARETGAALNHMLFTPTVGVLIAVCAVALSGISRRIAIYLLLLYLLLDLNIGEPFPISSALGYISSMTSSSFYGATLLVIPFGILAGLGIEKATSLDSSHRHNRLVLATLIGISVFFIAILPEPNAVRDSWSIKWMLIPACVLICVTLLHRHRIFHYAILSLLLVESIACGIVTADINFEFLAFKEKFADLNAKPESTLDSGRTMWANDKNRHLWHGRRAISGYDPLPLDATSRILANPGEEKHFSRVRTMSRNVSVASVLKRPFWLAANYVNGDLPEKTRLFPPAHVVFLTDDVALSLPRLELEDIPETTIFEPKVIQEFDFAAGTNFVTLPEVQVKKRTCAVRLIYSSPEPVFLSIMYIGRKTGERMSFKDLLLPISVGNSSSIELPAPNFSQMDVRIGLLGEDGKLGGTIWRVEILEDQADEIEHLEVVRDSPDDVIINLANIGGPRALVFTDAAYPGWRATIDGEPVSILQAHGAFKAVIVPTGDHKIRFEFRPWRVYVGIGISLVTLLSVIAAMLWCFSTRSHIEDSVSS
ncbi:MAG: YfhO family protein [Candidatus Hydrogenedentota bacterium]